MAATEIKRRVCHFDVDSSCFMCDIGTLMRLSGTLMLAFLTDYTRELFREAIPYSEINRMAEIVFLPRWQKLFVAAKRWKIATGNQVPW